MWHHAHAMVEALPSVTIVLPTLNEREFIRDAIDSLADQDYPHISEVLVVDGGSSDGTREIATRPSAVSVRVVDNPAVTAAGAMNRGLEEASGDVIVRADAHTLYAPSYVRRCVEVLLESNADNVGGRMQAVGTTRFGRAVAAVTSSPFGVGPGRFHYAEGRAEVETVYLGCWWTKTLRELDGWDQTSLQWAAEDQELNFRLRLRGGVVLLDSSIESWYFPRDSAPALRRQYFNYGVAKASTLAKHGRLPYLRPLAPAVMVLGALTCAILPGRRHRWLRRLLIPVGHGVASSGFALSLSRRPGVRFRDALAAVEICHWSYGVGFWVGASRMVRGQGFDARPSGHR